MYAVVSLCSSFGSANATPWKPEHVAGLVSNVGELDPSVGAACQSTVSESLSSLTDNLHRLLNLVPVISQSDFPSKTARLLDKQSRKLVVNNTPTRGKEISDS